MIMWCTLLDQEMATQCLFIENLKKKFMKLTAFAEFDRFSFKNHQRQEQPRQADSCKGQ